MLESSALKPDDGNFDPERLDVESDAAVVETQFSDAGAGVDKDKPPERWRGRACCDEGCCGFIDFVVQIKEVYVYR